LILKAIPILLLLVAAILVFSSIASINAVTFTQKDNEAKEEIISQLSKSVNSQYSQYKTVTATTHDNRTLLIYNQTEAPPPQPQPPQCPSGTFYNETSKTCQPNPNPPQPPTCPTGQHYNQTSGRCEDDVIIPPPPQPTGKPDPNVNTNTTFRTASIGDIDNNAGLVAQLNLAKKYHVQALFIIGDYGYSSCQGVVDKLTTAGFSKTNARIVEGNHDCAAITKAFNGDTSLYGSSTFANGKVEFFSLDGNTALDCSSAQFNTMKPKIESSDAWYNIAAIHQPFVTVKSTHSPNGQFACWDPLFRANGMNLVLEAHNHNYERFDVNGLEYMVVGTGTHDTGSSMYPLNGNSWNGFPCIKCITGTNGITIIDLQINDPHIKNMQGWFLSNAETVKDSFD